MDTAIIDSIKQSLSDNIPDISNLEVIENGECVDSITIRISSTSFEGKSMLAQHRMVQKALGELIKQVHALTIKTSIPTSTE